MLGDVLFHELGHHIHQLHIPEHEGPENVAEKWSKKLRGKLLRKRYWYLMSLLYPLARLYRWSKQLSKALGKSRT